MKKIKSENKLTGSWNVSQHCEFYLWISVLNGDSVV